MESKATKEQKSNDIEIPKDCLSCKLIGSTALLVASAYVFTRGIKARNQNTKIISAVFGSSLGYTGVARYLDLYPFNVKPSTMETQSTV